MHFDQCLCGSVRGVRGVLAISYSFYVCGCCCRQLIVRLITQRSQVQILPPQPGLLAEQADSPSSFNRLQLVVSQFQLRLGDSNPEFQLAGDEAISGRGGKLTAGGAGNQVATATAVHPRRPLQPPLVPPYTRLASPAPSRASQRPCFSPVGEYPKRIVADGLAK
jgi:hypothetical protein